MFYYYRSFIKNVPLQEGPSPVSRLTLLWACFILSVAPSIMPTNFVFIHILMGLLCPQNLWH
jgi:hypothetical protein